MIEPGEGVRITYEFRNSRPVELLDLTDSLAAFANRYEQYARARGFPGQDGTRLYIREMRSGSIIADMYALADQVSILWEHRDVLGGFVTHLGEIISILLSKPDQELAKDQIEDVVQIVEPVAKDNAAQLNIQVTDNSGTVLVAPTVITSADAQTIRRRARRRSQPLPADDAKSGFQQEVLTLFQARDDPKSRAGDRGIIEKFSEKPLKLLFENEDAKKAILDLEVNPFRLAFVVDGEVQNANGKPAAYKIRRVRDAFDRPEE